MVKKLHQLNLSQVYPAVLAGFSLDTFGDPDSGNFGVAPDFSIPVFKGKNATQRKHAAAASIPPRKTGLGFYTMSCNDHHPRISEVFEYAGVSVGWDDGRFMKCSHQRGTGNFGSPGEEETARQRPHLEMYRQRRQHHNHVPFLG
ncbi:hypothetical protein [uncultured Sulfitobacter sp.]|uniref:hypothetical protein n=1 Tax=uncultured Sulfitobacter sp. TaxID=191468 RepID=UPI0026237B61|nr:hypothetical protein [uncultured Sulfitobacter sp.]